MGSDCSSDLPKTAEQLANSLQRLHDRVKTCPKTFALIDIADDVSPLYSDPSRDRHTICVVEEPLDIVALEKTGQYQGTYHVLGGVISPIDGIGPEQLHIPELLERIKTDEATEIIIATNASVEGESTALFLQRYIQEAVPFFCDNLIALISELTPSNHLRAPPVA